MKKYKICIIGNSVALRIRPPLSQPKNKNYTALLSEELNTSGNSKNFIVENTAIGAQTVVNAYQKIEDFIHCFADVYIINIGVVDACKREVPLWFYRLATRKREDIFSLFFQVIYRRIISQMRPLLVVLRGKRSWISKRTFRKYLTRITETLLKETNGKLVFLPINLANERIEKALPGSRKSQIAFNTIIEEVSGKFDQIFLSLSDLKSAEDFPDGVHFSGKGHQVVAGKLKDIILQITNPL